MLIRDKLPEAVGGNFVLEEYKSREQHSCSMLNHTERFQDEGIVNKEQFGMMETPGAASLGGKAPLISESFVVPKDADGKTGLDLRKSYKADTFEMNIEDT
mmetsp:Transcript_21791/g.33683  ORF Transcript_21791/g.33683 Transcript_21791/m.33683 type:complete len:101 (+) Transcript_21791:3033-3335(+)